MRPLGPGARWHYCEVHVARLIPLSSSRPSRRRAALVLAALVLVAHLLLLGRTWPPPGPEHRAQSPRPLQVRQIVTTPGPTVPAAAPAVATVATAAPPARARPRSRTVRHGTPAAAEVGPASAAAAVDAAAVPTSPDAGGTPLPAYATRLPPAATLRYALRRGAATGQAELRWLPADGRYRLALDSIGPAGQRLGSVSQGALDASGIAPERYTEGRSGREARAVNFQHEAGRITYSGPSLQHALLPGAQDRLSWMLQLPAVLEAEPARRETGSEVLMFVAGPRGDGEVWVFTVHGRDTVHTPGGVVDGALHLRRQPRRPYDTQVDVWLDPARHHLPVRLHLLLQPTGSGAEFVLEQHTAP